jgi:two-component system LytT family sensor kinase
LGSVPGRPVAATGWQRHLDRYLAANLILWLFTYLLLTVRTFGGAATNAEIIGMCVRRAITCSVGFLLCAVVQRILLRTRDWPRRRWLMLAAGLSVAGGATYTTINYTVFYIIAPMWPDSEAMSSILWENVGNFSVVVWSFIAWCAVVFALSYDQEVREQSLRLVEAQALAAESQNQMLRYQINPHFLFNTLNALSSLILQKDFDRAERMVLSLSNFLRASLEKTPGERITLAEELAAQRQYLAIEQERFGERLRFCEAAPSELLDAIVPGLILQPLIENAVKYGVARSARPVRVEILAEARGGTLSVTVQDDGCQDIAAEGKRAPAALGVGLANVRRRLEVLYGEAGRLVSGARAEGGFAATIELPLERR